MSLREDGSTASNSPQTFTQWRARSQLRPTDSHADIVIVGAGRAGLHIAQSLSDAGRIALFDAEPWGPYDRVRLSNLLSREVAEEDIFFDLSCLADDRNLKLLRRRILRIDRRAKFVLCENQRRTYYGKLVLCLGSSARCPPIPGVELAGVYTFRNLGDGRRLIEHAGRAARAVVIGGGYLGLETASGLGRHGLECAVVETQSQLMPGQLDAVAAGELKAMLEARGIAAHTGRQVQQIVGTRQREVAAVRLDANETLTANMVVICTGVAPNVDLARDAGLSVGRGILVDDVMRTSDPHVYAVGECAEHRGRVYGLVGPVIEQAEIALEALRGGAPAYRGSVQASGLKIAGIELFIAGDMQCRDGEGTRVATYHDRGNRVYRAIAIRDGRIAGGVVIGRWDQTYRLRRLVEAGEAIGSAEAARFSRTGQLWADSAGAQVVNWPCEALVCNCQLVTKGAIDGVIASGARTSEAVANATGAAQLCGSCKPLIDQLLGYGAATARAPLLGALGMLSLVALAGLAVFLAARPWPVSPEISAAFRLENLWTDGLFKQVTGFSLFGSVLIAGLLFLRKRSSRGLPGSYTAWRLVHAGLGGVMIVTLFAHTGFALGSNLNGWLMASFLATLSAGGLAGLAAAVEPRLALVRPGSNGRLRRAAAWVHILVAWPLPLLLISHILMIYYF
jgi:nitrite reductase (NADH) large subunit